MTDCPLMGPVISSCFQALFLGLGEIPIRRVGGHLEHGNGAIGKKKNPVEQPW